MSMMSQRYYTSIFILLLSVVVLTSTTTDAFMPQQQHRSTVAYTPLSMAGFGGGAGAKKKQQKKDSIKKLKPKQQWDRYTNDLADADRVRVAVRVVKSTRPSSSDEDDANITTDEWFQVGSVKSKNNEFTQAAVICQRAIMVQHARRMFPLLILANDVLEWGYTTMQGEVFDDESCWVAVPSRLSESTTLPDDVDKMIGFVGLEDPTGFYAFHKKSELALESKVARNFESINAQRIHDN